MRKTLSLLLAVTMVFSCLLLAACNTTAATAAIGAISAKNGASILYGDANGDGEVNMKDALLVRRYIVDQSVVIDKVAADVDGDGDITMKDVLMTRKYIANLLPSLDPDVSEPMSDEPSEVVSDATSEPTSDEPSEVVSDVTSEQPSEEPSDEPSEQPIEEPSLEPIIDSDRDLLLTQWRGNHANIDGKPSYVYAKNGTLQIIQYTYDAGYIVDDPGTKVKWPEFLQSHGDLAADEYLILTFENADTFGLAESTSTDVITKFKDVGYAGVTKDNVSRIDVSADKIQVRVDGPLTVDPSAGHFNFDLSGCSLDKVDLSNTSTMTGAIYRKGAADDTVIYDEDVAVEMRLQPGVTLERDDITAALQAETAKYGVAERYIITVTCWAFPSDQVYSILLGANGTQVWPRNDYDHNYDVDPDVIDTVCTLLGSDFVSAGDVPNALYFYAESEYTNLHIQHIKIEVVRQNHTPTRPSTATTKTGPTTASTTRRPVDTSAYTYIDGKPYIAFRSYGDEGTLGTWWWFTSDVTNTTTCDNYLNFMQQNGVDEIYFYGYDWCKNKKADLHAFVQKANEKGMVVAILYDEAETIAKEPNNALPGLTATYLNYCAAYPSDRMLGFHFDIEGVSRTKMVNYMISQFAAAREQGVYLSMDVNCGWNDDLTLNGVTGFMNIASANLDSLSLMSYKDTAEGIWSLGAKPFAAAKAYGCKVIFGVEVGAYSFNPDNVAFVEEGAEVCYTELAKVYSWLAADHPTGGYGISVHAIHDWYKLKNSQ